MMTKTDTQIKKALKAVDGNISETARALNMAKTTLYDRISRTPELKEYLQELKEKQENKKLAEIEKAVNEIEFNSNIVTHREVIGIGEDYTSEDKIRKRFNLNKAEHPLEAVNISPLDGGSVIKTTRFKKNKDFDKLAPFAELIYAPKNYKVKRTASKLQRDREGFRLALIESDPHCHPVHFDFELNEVLNKFGKKLAPDESIGLGDDVHNDDFSRFPVEDAKLYSPLWNDVEIAREMTLGRVNALPEGTKFTRLVGNHDEPRNNKRLIQTVGAANANLLLKSWDDVLGYKEMGIDMILGDGGPNYPYGHYTPDGTDIRFIHGGPKSLEQYLDKYGITTVCGHYHTKEIITTHNQRQELIHGYKIPSLAKPDQGYSQDPKGHCQGFAVGTFYDNGKSIIEYADWDPKLKVLTFRGEQLKYTGS